MKKIGILGTGMVGATIGSKLIQLGYQVKMGSRSANNEKAAAWAAKNGPNASTGAFSDAADFGEIIFNCTRGDASPEVFRLTGMDRLAGKTVIDISNPLDFSKGMPPSLMSDYSNTYSMGEALQKLAPEAHIVKTLNIVNCEVMVDAPRSGGDPTMLLCGNDTGAKKVVTDILHQFGWNDIVDLGDISASRGLEMMLPVWLRTWMATGNGHFAFKIVR